MITTFAVEIIFPPYTMFVFGGWVFVIACVKAVEEYRTEKFLEKFEKEKTVFPRDPYTGWEYLPRVTDRLKYIETEDDLRW